MNMKIKEPTMMELQTSIKVLIKLQMNIKIKHVHMPKEWKLTKTITEKITSNNQNQRKN
jgi:hypothetical protein